MDGIGRREMIGIALLLFILFAIGTSQATTYPGEGTQINLTNGNESWGDTENAQQTVLDQPAIGEKVTYCGSESVFSVSYKPTLPYYAPGALIIVTTCAAYYFLRRYRRKGA